MRMTPAFLVGGSLVVFWSSLSIAVLMPAYTIRDVPSDEWRPLTPLEEEGHTLYRNNGCVYCHSMYIRTIDWGHGAHRIAEQGDYVGRAPPLEGTERTGPDLSQEGGERPDDWHRAHFVNPRFTRPESLMPTWEFLGEDTLRKLTAFLQAQGGELADYRVARQERWRVLALAAYQQGVDQNTEWLHQRVPEPWRAMPNPYPATEVDLLRGKVIYQRYCISCHGVLGDGMGPATPYMTTTAPPYNFTLLRRHLVDGKYLGGILYYQIMNGITGTSMPYFKRELTSEKIWQVSNYVAVTFVGYTDATLEPRGIPAAYEPPWRNLFPRPLTTSQVTP